MKKIYKGLFKFFRWFLDLIITSHIHKNECAMSDGFQRDKKSVKTSNFSSRKEE